MSFATLTASPWYMISSSPLVSTLIWAALVVVVLYLGRTPAHRIIETISHGLYSVCRLAAVAVLGARTRLLERNREVLLAAGREASERIIEREFERIDAGVKKDLAGYPELQRKVYGEITEIEKEYAKSCQDAPLPPGWVKAVEAVAKIPPTGDPMVANMLEVINKSVVEAHERAAADYRAVADTRHETLTSLRPIWRAVSERMDKVDKHVKSLLERSRTIDRHMKDYEEIQKATDRAERMLSSSSLVQFFVSAFVVLIAVGGAVINFNLIARPMSEMVGGTADIGGFRTADIAALVIILVEVSMGLFLMESLRITRLFPVIGALPDIMRRRMIGVTFFILAALASVEAGLAYMREILLQDELATSALLRGDSMVFDSTFTWITTSAQMGMGFILPFALVFVAIPLETFVHSSRTVIGIVAAAALQSLAFVFRLSGNLFHQSGRVIRDAYDIVIFLPYWVEQRVRAVVGAPFLRGRSGGGNFHSELDDEDAAMFKAPSLEGSLIQSGRNQFNPAE